VVSGITDLKHSIRDVVQTNPAFLGQYNPRWMQRLTDTSKASQETVEAFIDKFFSRLLAAHPAQGVDKLDWCGVPAGLLTTPINEAAQLEPLLEQFPLTARSMIWEVGTPEVLLSRCSPPILVTWGKQLLAAMARVTLTQIASLHKKPELTGLLDTWKEDIVRAASVDAAVQLATNQPRWGELLARAKTLPSVIVLRALTAITAIQ
ncbi:hypothetical protein DYB28_007194, partial [Aphanomyces astaci]